MNLKKRSPIEFTSKMSTFQVIFSVVWIAVHTALLPMLLPRIPAFSALSSAKQSLYWYVISVLVLVIINFTFLRREFDILVDRPAKVVFEVIYAFAIILAFDLVLSGLISLYMTVVGEEIEIANQNNANIMQQTSSGYGMVKACAVFLAPICEELMFRAGVFGGIRKYNRILAYIVSMLLFSAYHVWPYAVNDPQYWIYMLQYLPVSYILCRCYERSNTIWGSMLFHMAWNGVTLNILSSIA